MQSTTDFTRDQPRLPSARINVRIDQVMNDLIWTRLKEIYSAKVDVSKPEKIWLLEVCAIEYRFHAGQPRLSSRVSM